jgi:hypothetical protein
MKRLLQTTTILLLAAASCTLLVNPLPKLWFFTDGTGTPPGSGNPPGTTPALTPASFLELRPDGSYTRDFGKFDYGNWLRKDQKLILTSYDHKTFTYPLTMPNLTELQLSMTGSFVAGFESKAIPSEDQKKDPFSLYNNHWRIRAAHKESDDEIRQRLYNHCQFWETYFRWALDKELATVDVRSTPTAIKIYGNGFALKDSADLPAEWTSLFYDTEDRRKASDMIRNIFQHKTIAWAQTDNKYKMFLSAFQQLRKFLHQ